MRPDSQTHLLYIAFNNNCLSVHVCVSYFFVSSGMSIFTNDFFGLILSFPLCIEVVHTFSFRMVFFFNLLTTGWVLSGKLYNSEILLTATSTFLRFALR